MSKTFYCATCKIPIAVLPVSKPVTCPKCKQVYKNSTKPNTVPPISRSPKNKDKPSLPKTPPPAPEPATPEPATPVAATVVQRTPDANPAPSQPRSRTTNVQPIQTTSNWLNLFDVNFEKYLTPSIVQVIWILCLALTFLYMGAVLLLFSISLGLGSLTSSRLEKPPVRFENQVLNAQMSPQLFSNQTSSFILFGQISDIKRLGASSAVVMILINFVLILFGLLCIRLFLETIIVFFNIAKTLKSIEIKLDRRDDL